MPEKYKEEIEEILRRTGEVAPPPTAREADRRTAEFAPPTTPARRSVLSWPALSPGKLLLAGLILLLVGAFWQVWLLWTGLGLLVAAYLLFFVKPRSVSYEKRWRGRAVEERGSVWQKLKGWLLG